MQDIYVNRYFPWETPVTWIYRPMNIRRFARRYYWFKPGDILPATRKKMKFYMTCVVWLF